MAVAEYETANGPVDYALLDGGERAAVPNMAVSDVRTGRPRSDLQLGVMTFPDQSSSLQPAPERRG